MEENMSETEKLKTDEGPAESDLMKLLALTGHFDGLFFGSNNGTAVEWAKQYLDAGFKVELKTFYDGGWYTKLKIEPNGG
jgi:hypothetical protein